jgi:hypothetical protein
VEREQPEQNLPADEAYQMIRGPNQSINPNMCTVITSAFLDKVDEYFGLHREIEMTQKSLRREAIERLQRAADPEVMGKQRVNMAQKRTPRNVYVPTSPKSPRSESSGSVQIMEKAKLEVKDLSIDEIEAMLMDNVNQQRTQAKVQAQADSDAEDEARRSDKPVKRKKTADTNMTSARKDPLGPNPDKGRRLA